MHHYFAERDSGVFVCKGMILMKKLVCPNCKDELMDMDGIHHVEKKCKKCNRLISFIPETQQTKIKRMPPRETSSGCRFY